MQQEGLCHKKSNDTIGNRTRDLPACSAVPQATATPRAPSVHVWETLLFKGKGKSVPLQAWTGPEGSRKLRFPDSVTTAPDGGKVVSLTHRPLF